VADENDLGLEVDEAGAAFRVEMWAKNFVLGYWKYIFGAIGLTLLIVLVWDQVSAHNREVQRDGARAIAMVEQALPGPIPSLGGMAQTGTTLDSVELDKAASELQEVGAEFGGATEVEALLKAAEIYRVIGESEKQRAVLESASEGADGAMGYAVQSGLASLDVDAGNRDAAVERYNKLIAGNDSFVVQQATLDLGMLYEADGDNAAASGVYQEFLAKWSDNSGATAVRERLDALGGAGE